MVVKMMVTLLKRKSNRQITRKTRKRYYNTKNDNRLNNR